jgi:MFS family permease
MALALPTTSALDRTADASIARWTGMSAVIALALTVPFVAMLAGPVSSVLFVRGTEHDGSWGYASLFLMVVLAPATYALFFVTAGEMLKERVDLAAHKRTMRFAAAALVPYMVMVITAAFWTTGPQLPMMVTAALTIPIAMVATVWFSAQPAQRRERPC